MESRLRCPVTILAVSITPRRAHVDLRKRLASGSSEAGGDTLPRCVIVADLGMHWAIVLLVQHPIWKASTLWGVPMTTIVIAIAVGFLAYKITH